jgi:hypothetical protein
MHKFMRRILIIYGAYPQKAKTFENFATPCLKNGDIVNRRLKIKITKNQCLYYDVGSLSTNKAFPRQVKLV